MVQILGVLLPWVGFTVGGILVAVGTMVITVKILALRRLWVRPAVCLELTPPMGADKAPEATQRLFSVLHGLRESRTLTDKLLRRQAVFSLEVTSSREQGIRYILRVAESEASTFEQAIVSYLPDVKFRRVDDYIPKALNRSRIRVLEFKQTGYFAYPLQAQGLLEEHDPMAYLTGTMTKLESGELVALQMVMTPTKVRAAEAVARRIMNNEELVYQLGRRRLPTLAGTFSLINELLFSVADGVGEVTNGQTKPNRKPDQNQAHRQQVAMKIKPARTLSQFEQKLAESVHNKLSKPFFRVSIRALIVADNQQSRNQRVKGIRDWLALFTVQGYQSLRPKFNLPSWLKTRYRLAMFERRLPSLFAHGSCLLSTAEAADLYHFPHSGTAKTENVIKSLSKTLPAPISLKNNSSLDVILGRNHHHGADTNIGLTTADRERHVYVIGGTGNGKTTMLQYAIVQDIQNGKGLAVVDPHGDLAETMLRYIPEERIKDVIYFNPDDLAHPVGLNILELAPGLTGDDLIREKDLLTESVISIFRKIFSDDDTGGHRIEYVLRNAIHTALTVEGATLFTVYNLLNDPKFCKKVISTLDNEDLLNFWKNEMGKAGTFQQVKMVAGITAKIGRFLFSASAKRILEQPKSTINFDEILDGKILICNFSKGLLGEDTSELFGISVLAKIQMAALRRARTKQADRKPFYLYVDEFQNFATPSFVQMLSEARKYKLFLTMAEQSTSQQDDQQMVNIILANVGTVVCFRSGNPADEKLVLPLFKPYVEEGEIANLPSYNFYMRIAAMSAQEPFSGETLLLDSKGDKDIAERVVKASRAGYAITYVAHESTPKIEMNQDEENAARKRSAPKKKPGSAKERKPSSRIT
jgi:hypothetical protein